MVETINNELRMGFNVEVKVEKDKIVLIRNMTKRYVVLSEELK